MNKKTFIKCKKNLSIELQSVTEQDLEDLRFWKNINRNSFFYTSEISSNQQIEWFKKYENRIDDFMFVVVVNKIKIGCLGFRKLEKENQIDIYNIILGNEDFGKKGYMTIALNTMCNYASNIYKLDITVKVLKTNPAATWYKKNNFIEISPQNDYFYLKLNKENFEDYSFEITT